MTLDEIVRLLLAASNVAIAIAGVGLAAALAILARAVARTARPPDLGSYEIVVPPGSPPAAELFFTHLHALLRQVRPSFALPSPPIVLAAQSSAAGLRLLVNASERDAHRLSATLGTIWPGASLVRRSARMLSRAAIEWHPRIADRRSVSALPGAELTLARALARAEAGDELSFELVLRPAAANEHGPIWDLRPSPVPRPTKEHDRRSERRRDSPAELLGCRVVIGARGSTDGRTQLLLDQLAPTVHVLCAGTAVDLGRAHGPIRAAHPRFSGFGSGRLHPRELAVLFPLPSLAAAVIATSTQRATDGERLLGTRTVGRTEQDVRLSLSASRQHLHVLGPTGMGKSTLLLNLAAQDIAAGRGCAVLDPKGDLVRDLLARIPRSRVPDVVYVGPDEGARAIGINPLALAPGEDPHLAAENVLSIFKRIYAENWGPRTDDVLKACLLTLVGMPGATLAHIPALLSDPQLRRRLTGHVDDAIGVGSFWRWYERISESRRLEATAPLLNKLRDFLVRPPLRHLLCQASSNVDLGLLTDRGGILLADLGTGRWGEAPSALAGSILVARLWQAALSRQAQREEQRRDFLLYVDEFQSFLGIGGPFADALAQARGLRLSLTLANQHLAQLPRHIRDAVSANARSRIVFRCAAHEAGMLAADLAPLEAGALAALPPFDAAARLSTGAAFTMRTLPPSPRPIDAADPEQVIAASAARYGRDVASIDSELRELLGADEPGEESPHERTGS